MTASQTSVSRYWSGSAGLIVSPAIASVAIPIAFQTPESIGYLLDPRTCCFDYPLGRALPIALVAAWSLGLAIIVVWQAVSAYRFVGSVYRGDRSAAFAFAGVGLLAASYVAYMLPSLLVDDFHNWEQMWTLSLWSDWIPALLLAAGAPAFLSRGLPVPAVMGSMVPMVPLISVSLAENTRLPHAHQCPAAWTLPIVQGPWVSAGLAVCFAALLALLACHERQDAVARGSNVTLVVALIAMLAAGYLCVQSFAADWFQAGLKPTAIAVCDAVIVAALVFVGTAWAWRAVRARPTSTLTTLAVVGAVLIAIWVPTATNRGGPTDCLIFVNVHNLTGPFYW